MGCPACAVPLERTWKKLPGVRSAVINPVLSKAFVEIADGKASLAEVLAVPKSYGIEALVVADAKHGAPERGNA